MKQLLLTFFEQFGLTALFTDSAGTYCLIANALLIFLNAWVSSRNAEAQAVLLSQKDQLWTPAVALKRLRFVVALCVAMFSILALVCAYTFRSPLASIALGIFLIIDTTHTTTLKRKN
jgi:hypothetical protein